MTANNSTWTEFYNHGIQYMKTAERSVMYPDKFTPLIIYNLSAIAIEKLIMGVCMFSGTLPFCHTLSGMTGFVKDILWLDEQLVNDMNLMDSMQMICSESEHDLFHADPDSDDVMFFIDVMKRIFNQTELYLNSGR